VIRYALLIIAALVLCAPSWNAQAQGVWSQLERAGKALPQAAPPGQEPTLSTFGKGQCEAALRQENSRLLKCRGHYLSIGYAVEWRVHEPELSHPIVFVVLVRGDDAVMCINRVVDEMNEWSPCTPMRKVK
jgi:hypothetical protein